MATNKHKINYSCDLCRLGTSIFDFIFDFNDKNTYLEFITLINADKLHMIVTYDFFPTGIDDKRCICTLYLGDKRYIQHKTIK